MSLFAATREAGPSCPGLPRKVDADTTECGLPAISLHDLRHGACSLMLTGGVPDAAYARLARCGSTL
jgi:hypothetical protein